MYWASADLQTLDSGIYFFQAATKWDWWCTLLDGHLSIVYVISQVLINCNGSDSMLDFFTLHWSRIKWGPKQDYYIQELVLLRW